MSAGGSGVRTSFDMLLALLEELDESAANEHETKEQTIKKVKKRLHIIMTSLLVHPLKYNMAVPFHLQRMAAQEVSADSEGGSSFSFSTDPPLS